MSGTSRLTYIRNTYGVPAKKGGRIEFRNEYAIDPDRALLGTIVGALNGRLRVRMDHQPDCVQYFHPTWGITYL